MSCIGKTLPHLDEYTTQDLFGFISFVSPSYAIWVICKRSFRKEEWNAELWRHELLHDFFYDLADTIAGAVELIQ